MSDVELAGLFYQLVGAVETSIVDYTSVLFAFLVFAYFAADRLKPGMAVIVVVLFTAFCMDKLLLFILLSGDLVDLSLQLERRVANGASDLGFIAGARGEGRVTEFFQPVRVLLLVGGYAGALLFFLNRRQPVDLVGGRVSE